MVRLQSVCFQDMLFLDPSKIQFPKWIFNFDVSPDCSYKFVPTELLPPACLEPNIAGTLLAFHICGEPQEILLATLERGQWLTADQIWSIVHARGLPGPDPEKKNKRSSMKKILVATYLVDALFPDLQESDPAKRDFIIASMMTKRKLKQEDSSELLLKLMGCLDTSEAQHFDKFKKSCVDDLYMQAMQAKAHARRKNEELDEEALKESQRKRAAESAATGERDAKKPRTQGLSEEDAIRHKVKAPKEFLQFFPNISHCYLKYLSKQNKVTVEFVHKERNLQFL